MTQLHDNIVGIDAAIFMHPTTWKASGTRRRFQRPDDRNKESKEAPSRRCIDRRCHRKMEDKIEKEVEKAAKKIRGIIRSWGSLLQPTREVVEYQKKIEETNARLKDAMK